MTEARWAGLAGILFAVLFVVGVILTDADRPQADESDDEFIEYYDDSGNRMKHIAAAYVLVLSALAFLAFTTVGLYGPLRPGARHTSRLGAVAAGMTAVGIGVFAITSATAAATVEFSDVELDPAFARFIPDVGYGMLLIWGALSASASIAAFSLAGRRAGKFPAALTWFGYVAAFALLFAVVFIPLVALPLWALVVGIWMVSQPGQRPAAA